MKNPRLLLAGMVVIMMFTTMQLNAQEDASKSNFQVGADVYTNYIWRGSKLGQGLRYSQV